jgi:hypothetical protein
MKAYEVHILLRLTMVTNEGFALDTPILVWRWTVNLPVRFMHLFIST